jgi:RNA exonuclease 1
LKTLIFLNCDLKDANATKKKRIAHTLKAASGSSSSSALIKKPTVFPEIGSKVPINLRQRYLDLFIEECIKLESNKQKAYDRVSIYFYFIYKNRI